MMKYKIKYNDESVLDRCYLEHEGFTTLPKDAQDLLIMVMSFLNDAHTLEIDLNKDVRPILEQFSPNNKLLESEEYISWGRGLHDLLSDIITHKDILSPTFKPKVKH